MVPRKGIGAYRVITIFRRKVICLTVPQNFVGGPLCFRKFLESKSFMHEGGRLSVISVVLIKLNNLGKDWDSKPVVLPTVRWEHWKILTNVSEILDLSDTKDLNPDLTLQTPVVLPNVPWEQLEFLTNVTEINKNYYPTEIRTWTYCSKNFCPHCTAETLCLRIKIVGNDTLKKDTIPRY